MNHEMSADKLQPKNLVLYKTRPARILSLGEKIEIELGKNNTKKVRDKDIYWLHPGPLNDARDLIELHKLEPVPLDLNETWALLEGETTPFSDILALMFEEASVTQAWALWLQLADGLYFEGMPDALTPRTAEQVQADKNFRAAKAKAEQEWQDFLDRLSARSLIDEDRQRLNEVEQVAHGLSEKSRILDALKIGATPASAHRMLVNCGYWSEEHNPHPGRLRLVTDSPDLPVDALPSEDRVDLTHLAAYAIDDEDSNDPDDALTLDGDRIWVHVADVAALVPPDSALDAEARERGANLYLPEGVSHMLPPALTEQLGLGLHAESPALSIGFRLDETAQLTDIQIVVSRIQATRISYVEANQRLSESPFVELQQLTERYRQRRQVAGASRLDLPEVSVRLRDGKPQIKPLPRIESRELVADAMLMAGEAVAHYCQQHQIPIPFAMQPPPAEVRTPETLSQMVAYRRCFKPSRSSVTPEPHAGLGLTCYTRATSPLRRYQDLLVHQQLRRHLAGQELLSVEEVSLRAAQSDEGVGLRRRAERLSNLHWKLVWLQQRSGWRGSGVVVDKDERKLSLLLPELAMETKVRLQEGPELDTEVVVKVGSVDLAEQTASFRLEG